MMACHGTTSHVTTSRVAQNYFMQADDLVPAMRTALDRVVAAEVSSSTASARLTWTEVAAFMKKKR